MSLFGKSKSGRQLNLATMSHCLPVSGYICRINSDITTQTSIFDISADMQRKMSVMLKCCVSQQYFQGQHIILSIISHFMWD